MFLHVSVILFTGGGIPACIAGGIPACLAAGLGGGGIPACLAGFQAHTWGGEVEGSGLGGCFEAHTQEVSRPTPSGVSMPTPGGLSRSTLGGGVSQHALRQSPPTATAAGSTHPTGMNSCFILNFWEAISPFCVATVTPVLDIW